MRRNLGEISQDIIDLVSNAPTILGKGETSVTQWLYEKGREYRTIGLSETGAYLERHPTIHRFEGFLRTIMWEDRNKLWICLL